MYARRPCIEPQGTAKAMVKVDVEKNCNISKCKVNTHSHTFKDVLIQIHTRIWDWPCVPQQTATFWWRCNHESLSRQGYMWGLSSVIGRYISTAFVFRCDCIANECVTIALQLTGGKCEKSRFEHKNTCLGASCIHLLTTGECTHTYVLTYIKHICILGCVNKK